MIHFDAFFMLLALLTAVDAWSTYKGLKAVGLKEALTLIKVGYLWAVWTYPPETATAQWVILGLYAAVSVNNLRVLKKAGVI